MTFDKDLGTATMPVDWFLTGLILIPLAGYTAWLITHNYYYERFEPMNEIDMHDGDLLNAVAGMVYRGTIHSFSWRINSDRLVVVNLYDTAGPVCVIREEEGWHGGYVFEVYPSSPETEGLAREIEEALVRRSSEMAS